MTTYHSLYFKKNETNDYTYRYAIQLLEKAKFLMHNYGAKIKVTNTDSVIQSIFLEDPKYISVLLDCIKQEIEDLKINRIALSFEEVNTAFEENKNKEWVDAYIIKNFGKTNLSELTSSEEAILKEYYSVEFAHVFSIYHRGFIDEKIKTLKEWEEATGERSSKKKAHAITHIGIHSLSLLLRIDEHIMKSKRFNSIEVVKLSNLHCQFIYDFLVFFKISPSI